MKTNKLMLCVLGFVLAFTVAAASAADAPNLTFKFRTINLPGEMQTHPTAISNTGVTVGYYVDPQGVQYGYIFNGTTLTTLADPNGTNTVAWDINYNGTMIVGQVVGSYFNTSTQETTGFLYTISSGEFMDILPPGAVSSVAYGINDNGAIVGFYDDSSGVVHGFLWVGGVYTTLDVPTGWAAKGTSATDINNAGYITFLWYNQSGNFEGAVCHLPCKKYKTINAPFAGSMGSFPSFINNEGDITFQWYEDPLELPQSALRTRDGAWYKFVDSKVESQSLPGGINDNNAFVGAYTAPHSALWSGYKATF